MCIFDVHGTTTVISGGGRSQCHFLSPMIDKVGGDICAVNAEAWHVSNESKTSYCFFLDTSRRALWGFLIVSNKLLLHSSFLYLLWIRQDSLRWSSSHPMHHWNVDSEVCCRSCCIFLLNFLAAACEGGALLSILDSSLNSHSFIFMGVIVRNDGEGGIRN
jgi:hypothetical protein